MSKSLLVVAMLAALFAVWMLLIRKVATSPSAAADGTADVAQLREQVKKLEGLVPDQAAIMIKVAYHFSNLWFAVEQENWPLADFYLGETRANVKWAVRAKPVRKGANNEDVDLGAIAQALDSGPFTDLKKAIDAKQKALFAERYDTTLSFCYSCHKASNKPYLHLQRPTAPESRLINMNPKADN